jgi:hypothetical protein
VSEVRRLVDHSADDGTRAITESLIPNRWWWSSGRRGADAVILMVGVDVLRGAGHDACINCVGHIAMPPGLA